MKKLLIASVIAVASAAAVITPANATHIIIGFGNGYMGDGYGDYYGNGYNDYYGGYYGNGYGSYYGDDDYYRYGMYENGYRPRYFHRHHHYCQISLVRHWHHHHRMIERIRICR